MVLESTVSVLTGIFAVASIIIVSLLDSVNAKNFTAAEVVVMTDISAAVYKRRKRRGLGPIRGWLGRQ